MRHQTLLLLLSTTSLTLSLASVNSQDAGEPVPDYQWHGPSRLASWGDPPKENPLSTNFCRKLSYSLRRYCLMEQIRKFWEKFGK